MIRLGTIEDIKQVNTIRKQVNDLHAKGEKQYFKPGFSKEMADYLYEFLNDDNKKLIVCEVDNQICAFAMIEFIVKPETVYRYEQKFIEIQELGTLENEQGKGYAKLIIDKVKDIAKENGFSRIELNAWAFNEKALKFYEKIGFETFKRHLRLFF